MMTPFRMEVLEVIEITAGVITVEGLHQVTGRSEHACQMAATWLGNKGLVRRRRPRRRGPAGYRITPHGVSVLRNWLAPDRWAWW